MDLSRSIIRSGIRSDRRSLLKSMAAGAGALAAGPLLARPAIAQAREITMISDASNNRPVVDRIAADFERDTGVKVTINGIDHESNKTAIRNYLVTSPPDVCFWFSGNRMRAFVKRGLFDDITDLFQREKFYDVLGVMTQTVSVDDRQYGLPTGGSMWGILYRKDVFAQHGLTTPKTWDEMIATCDKAAAAGLVPLGIGTKELWPAAGWFDYLNLRINGLDYHMRLMDGQATYLDPELTAVFDRWEDLIKRNYFLPNHTSYSWQQAAAFLVQGKAAMFFLGNFARRVFPDDQVEQLGFIPFPQIQPGVGPFEEFSVNSIHIPARAKNKELARDFLAYFYRPENLGAYLQPDGNIPARKDVKMQVDPLMQSVVDTLQAAKGTSQFYDRDTDPDMAQAGLNAFQEFMVAPQRRQAILQRLETTRKRVFKT